MCGGGDHDATTFAVGFNGRALLHCCTRLHCMDGRYVDRGVVQRWMSLSIQGPSILALLQPIDTHLPLQVLVQWCK